MDPKQRKRRVQELGVGAVVVAGLALLAAGILWIGQENRVFVRRTGFRTVVTDASGLRAGSPVTMSGVRIGSIDQITLPMNPGANGIVVHFTIDRDFAPRLREGTVARIAILQIVAAEKMLTLTPGDPSKPALRPESLVPVGSASAILETGKNIAETVEQITADLRDILDAIRNGQGLLGKAIVDPEFSRESMDRLGSAIRTTSMLLDRVNRGEGLLGKVLVDQEYSARLTERMGSIADSLAETSRRLQQGQGLLGQMTVNGPADDLLGNMNDFSASLKEVGAALRRGDGLAGLLVSDRERSGRIANNLDQAAANLASITRKVDDGQGTLGLLVNDRSLHDNANQLVTGARQSRMLSWIIRRLNKKGAASRAPATPRPDPGGGASGGGADGSHGPYSALAPGGGAEPDRVEREASPPRAAGAPEVFAP